MELPLLARVQASIFRIKARDGSTAGAAFAVGSDGLVVTCMHVVEAAELNDESLVTLVHYESGEEALARYLPEFSRPSSREDVAVLKLEGGGVPASLSLAAFRLQPGSSLYSFGFPEGKNLEGMPGRAIVTGPSVENGCPVVAVSSPDISAGFSGGPAVDEATGLVVGVVTSIMRPDTFGRLASSAFLVPAETVLQLCPSLPIGLHPRLEQYTAAVRKQLTKSAYFIAGLPDYAPIEAYAPPALRNVRDGSTLDLDEIIHADRLPDEPAICIVGDAGSGKSTLLRNWALQLTQRPYRGNLILPIYITAKAFASSPGLDFSDRVREALRQTSVFGFDLQIPDAFVTTWARDYGVRFVVMIDACDEISDLRKRDLCLRALRLDLAPYLKESGHILVVASRDVAQLKLIKDNFFSIFVDSLPVSSQILISTKVLGSDTDEFQKFLKRMSHRSLVFSPLTLLLLLALFRQKKAHFDANLISIYEEYLQLCGEEWLRRGMQDAVGREISDFAIDAVSILAWHDVGGSFDEEQALSTITAFIADQTNRGQYAAGKAAEKLIRFLGEEGGLFRIVDGVPSWIHQNIRDFMAARTLCILQDAMPAGVRNGLTRDVIELTEDNWSDANRESFVRFVLCMFPDETISQSAVQALLSQGGDSLPFLARALSDGAPISSTLCEELADRLFESAAENFGTCANIFVLASHDPVLAFMMLSWKGPFYTRARAVLRGDLKPAAVQRTTDFQAEIASYLSRLCDASQLEELGRDPQIEQFLRTQLADQPSTVP